MGRAVLLGVISLLALIVSACGEMPVQPVSEESATIEAGYSRAFGRVVYVEDGKRREWKWVRCNACPSKATAVSSGR